MRSYFSTFYRLSSCLDILHLQVLSRMLKLISNKNKKNSVCLVTQNYYIFAHEWNNEIYYKTRIQDFEWDGAPQIGK